MNSTKSAEKPQETSASANTLEDVVQLLRKTLGELVREVTVVTGAEDILISGVVLDEARVYERELLPMDHIIISLAGLETQYPAGVHELE